MPNAANIDVIHGNRGFGGVATALLQNGMDPLCLRPWIGTDGRSYVTNIAGGEPKAMLIANDATLRVDEWKLLDTAVIAAAKPRLRVVGDLVSRGLVYNIPNGMATTVFQSQAQSDITPADVSMDGMRKSDRDRPVYDLTNLPLPIIHKDFSFSAREVMVSRQGGSPLDTTTAMLAARRVAETAEQLLLGTYGTYQFGGGTIYGYTNFPSSNIVELSDWTDSGVTGSTILNDVLRMKNASVGDHHYGPWVLYVGPNFGNVLEDDYKTYSDKTTRQRLLEIEGISDVRTVDYMNDDEAILVEMSQETVREVIGMNVQAVQWSTDGGMQLHFKVMAIMVPQIRSDFYGNCGIVHGTIPGGSGSSSSGSSSSA